jgi:hypothetical protein
MPPQSIASGAGRETILGAAKAAFVALDHMVNLPVPVRMLNPTAVLENDWVAAKVAMPTRFIEDRSKSSLSHLTHSISTNRLIVDM